MDGSRWRDVIALVGTNESGKTNVLLPLWKFNPAKEGAIVATADYPRKRYNEFRNQKLKPVFIRAVFDAGEELANKLGALVISSKMAGHYKGGASQSPCWDGW